MLRENSYIDLLFVGQIVLLDKNSELYKNIEEFSDIHRSLKHVVEGYHPFVVVDVDYAKKTFKGKNITASYDSLNNYRKQFYFPLPGDPKDYGLMDKLDQTRAVSIYEITPDLPFSAVYKQIGYIPDAVLNELNEKIKQCIQNPQKEFIILEKNFVYKKNIK